MSKDKSRDKDKSNDKDKSHDSVHGEDYAKSRDAKDARERDAEISGSGPPHYEPSQRALEEAEAHAHVLPMRFRTARMRVLLARTLYDGRFRVEFRANPKPFLREAGFPIADHVKVDVHENAEDTLHIILPGVQLAKAPRKAKSTGGLSLAQYEAQGAGKTVIEDDDLDSGPAVALFKDDVMDPDWWADPKTADGKTDRVDGTDGVVGTRDPDANTAADTADTGAD